jgi:hypothetical protein
LSSDPIHSPDGSALLQKMGATDIADESSSEMSRPHSPRSVLLHPL